MGMVDLHFKTVLLDFPGLPLWVCIRKLTLMGLVCDKPFELLKLLTFLSFSFLICNIAVVGL